MQLPLEDRLRILIILLLCSDIGLYSMGLRTSYEVCDSKNIEFSLLTGNIQWVYRDKNQTKISLAESCFYRSIIDDI